LRYFEEHGLPHDWPVFLDDFQKHWPTDEIIVAEVYPSPWRHYFAKEKRNADQQDAYSVAAWMRRSDLDGTLGIFFNPGLAPAEREVARIEGWILGVM
jgi:hypothetical protein